MAKMETTIKTQYEDANITNISFVCNGTFNCYLLPQVTKHKLYTKFFLYPFHTLMTLPAPSLKRNSLSALALESNTAPIVLLVRSQPV